MAKNIKGEGDPVRLLEVRGDTYADFTLGVTSTPTAGTVEIEEDDASKWTGGPARSPRLPSPRRLRSSTDVGNPQCYRPDLAGRRQLLRRALLPCRAPRPPTPQGCRGDRHRHLRSSTYLSIKISDVTRVLSDARDRNNPMSSDRSNLQASHIGPQDHPIRRLSPTG
jgi:hypothetical protein